MLDSPHTIAGFTTEVQEPRLALEPRFVVVLPTFNHATFLPGVLTALEKFPWPIVAINDGSSDSTAQVLSGWEREASGGHAVITHPENRGKAAALLTGFAAARGRGFTHALTIDSDGQHDPNDLHALVAAARSNPDALIVGARPAQIPGYPWTGRFGRWFSNHAVWAECGARVHDTQSGLRCYPLAKLPKARAGRYAYETEIITRAAWAGIPIVEVPITCTYTAPEGRVTHFRVLPDSLASLRLHAALFTLAWLPGAPARASVFRRLWRWAGPKRFIDMLRGSPQERACLAGSVAAGSFMAIAPLYGIKTVACLWLAARLRLHPGVVIAVSSLSTPPIGLAFVLASIWIGHAILGSGDAIPSWAEMTVQTFRDRLFEWIVGSLLLGFAAAIVTYAVTLALVRLVPSRTTAISGESSNTRTGSGT
jgi:uncharacterized protein (DUF2062 family)